jgi:hypothetical protein
MRERKNRLAYGENNAENMKQVAVGLQSKSVENSALPLPVKKILSAAASCYRTSRVDSGRKRENRAALFIGAGRENVFSSSNEGRRRRHEDMEGACSMFMLERVSATV